MYSYTIHNNSVIHRIKSQSKRVVGNKKKKPKCVVAVVLMFTLSRQLESYDSLLNIRDVLSCY